MGSYRRCERESVMKNGRVGAETETGQIETDQFDREQTGSHGVGRSPVHETSVL